MTIAKPFRRTFRLGGLTALGGVSEMSELIRHPKYATDLANYVRALGIIQADFRSMTNYIEPADQNERAFSFRTHELLVRTAIEVEANLKAILVDNKYATLCNGEYKNAKNRRLDMGDYKKIEVYLTVCRHIRSRYQIGAGAMRSGPHSLVGKLVDL
jgi:hypothetical protein